MTALELVYDHFYDSGICTMTMQLSDNNLSMCSPDGFIAIDNEKFCYPAEERTALIHEDGHFISGAFYLPYSPYVIREQAECKANKAAIQKYIPLNDLKNCLETDMPLYEISNYFCVTEDFALNAYLYYKDIGALL